MFFVHLVNKYVFVLLNGLFHSYLYLDIELGTSDGVGFIHDFCWRDSIKR